MKNIITIALIFFSATLTFGQSEKCGTVQNLDLLLKIDPSLRSKLDNVEIKNREWIKLNNRGFKEHFSAQNNRTIKVKTTSGVQNINALCGNDNVFYTSIDAPTTLNQIVSPTNNCTFGGEYVRVDNLVAGNTYRISTIGTDVFDTVLSIFLAGGGNPVAYNNDWDTSYQSEIYFTPFVSGNYDILIDEIGCQTNELCASLQVELWYIPRPIITIPVVVHIFHKGEPSGVGTNISVAQIQSQIDVLNEDFRRLNSNLLFSPAPFRGESADPLIQFCLAQQKPDGSPTDGIIRYLEPSQQYYASLPIPIVGNFPVDMQCLNMYTLKHIEAATIWDKDKYLNFWVSDKLRQLPPQIFGVNNPFQENLGCDFESAVLGIAQFPVPTTPPSSIEPDYSLTDGVWVTASAFGTTGNVQIPYHLGKTAVHEVGHWLNLKHIWGDEPLCAQDDDVTDTPLQSINTNGCNPFPSTDSCTPLFPGIMFMNHMDYSFDDCRSIFTYGQCVRMDATLFNERASLLTSIGCTPSPLSINENLLEGSVKTYPNPFLNQLTIEANKPIYKIEIYSLLGQKLKNIEFNSPAENLKNIDLSELAQGNYLAKIYFEHIVKSIKIIKK